MISHYERRHWWSLRKSVPVYDRAPSSSSSRGVRITERLAREIEQEADHV
jgi:hypothetical protein